MSKIIIIKYVINIFIKQEKLINKSCQYELITYKSNAHTLYFPVVNNCFFFMMFK